MIVILSIAVILLSVNCIWLWRRHYDLVDTVNDQAQTIHTIAEHLVENAKLTRSLADRIIELEQDK